MSAENVDLVRRNFEAIQRALDAYWREPRSIVKALDHGTLWPEWEAAFGFLHPDAEWRTVFLGQTFRGHREFAGVWDDFLRAFRDYRPHLVEVEDMGGDRVYLVMEPEGVGRDSPLPMDWRLHSIFTVRDGLVVRLEEYLSSEEAMEAAGAGEQA
ncbi:MAG TPA: nuclear transport factor 2 family protein [Thermoleophilaceae bacterium]|nr:nuclear transport factor 2 family protein [Thermoleophilaceae bacterium]